MSFKANIALAALLAALPGTALANESSWAEMVSAFNNPEVSAPAAKFVVSPEFMASFTGTAAPAATFVISPELLASFAGAAAAAPAAKVVVSPELMDFNWTYPGNEAAAIVPKFGTDRLGLTALATVQAGTTVDWGLSKFTATRGTDRLGVTAFATDLGNDKAIDPAWLATFKGSVQGTMTIDPVIGQWPGLAGMALPHGADPI